MDTPKRFFRMREEASRMRRQPSSVGSPLLRWGDETMPTNSRSRMASTDSPWRLARSSTVS